MRARVPEASGLVDRDGVAIHYDVYGTGDTTLLLMPAWAIVHSGLWKAQVPYLSQRYRVITYDPRGNGASDRPTEAAAYGALTQAADALAVLDAVGVDRAFVVGHSAGTAYAYLLAALHPDRVAGAVFIGTNMNVDGREDYPLARALQSFDDDLGCDEGWARYNRHSFARDFPGFVAFFMNEACSDPHSSRLVEDGTDWGLQTTPDVLAATVADRAGVAPAVAAERLRALAPKIACPILVVHGSEDRVCPVKLGRSLARLLDAPLVEMGGAGHCPQVRYPVQINRLIRRFVENGAPPGHPGDALSPRRRRRTAVPRVLYLSSPIGLGHARRDLAIVRELRQALPDLHVDWLAQDPVTRVLSTAGEHVHSASARLASESAHLESEATEHELEIFQAVRRMDEILIANFMTFLDVTDDGHYDLVVGDEAWDVDHFLHEDPTAKRTRFAWLTDFVGNLPMPAGGDREIALTTDYNAEMLEHVERNPHIRDTAIFVGDPGDVVRTPFGPGLPDIREWTEAHYRFSGFITGFEPAELGDRDELRAQLGYHPEETVVLAAVGGSGVGKALLRRIIDAHPLAGELVPNLRTVVVTGPRLDPEGLPSAPGVEKRAYVPDLHRHLAACDLAVVQGGLGTTMELTAARRPFLYFPLRNHFEQQIHVRHRLERHRAGRALDYATATPEAIASAIAGELGRSIDYRPVDGRGAQRAASIIAELL